MEVICNLLVHLQLREVNTIIMAREHGMPAEVFLWCFWQYLFDLASRKENYTKLMENR